MTTPSRGQEKPGIQGELDRFPPNPSHHSWAPELRAGSFADTYRNIEHKPVTVRASFVHGAGVTTSARAPWEPQKALGARSRDLTTGSGQ